MGLTNCVYIGPYIKVYGETEYDGETFFTPEFTGCKENESIYILTEHSKFMSEYYDVFHNNLSNLDSDLLLLRFIRKHKTEIQKFGKNKDIIYGIVYYSN